MYLIILVESTEGFLFDPDNGIANVNIYYRWQLELGLELENSLFDTKA